MVTALNPKKRIIFVTEGDKGVENPTRFTLRPMTIFDRAEIAETLTTSADMDIRRVIELVRLCLEGCDGLTDGEGDPILYETREDGRASDDFMSCLPEETLVEIFNRVAKAEEVSPQEAKKSNSRGTRRKRNTKREVPEVSGAES